MKLVPNCVSWLHADRTGLNLTVKLLICSWRLAWSCVACALLIPRAAARYELGWLSGGGRCPVRRRCCRQLQCAVPLTAGWPPSAPPTPPWTAPPLACVSVAGGPTRPPIGSCSHGKLGPTPSRVCHNPSHPCQMTSLSFD